MADSYILPSKTISYLKRLRTEYTQTGNSLFASIFNSSRFFVRTGATYDNFGGGTTGHNLVIFPPTEVFAQIRLSDQEKYCETICSDLNTCARSVSGEFFSAVSLDDSDEQDSEFQQAFTLESRPQPNPDTLSIWKPDHVRLFISHRDQHKVGANKLALELENFGISAFVAHDTIQPMKTWRNEILKGLQTMEIMLAFVTDDFHDSAWTNQEIGFALGRDIPIVSLKLENSDPPGFISAHQAMKGQLAAPAKCATALFDLIISIIGDDVRLTQGLVLAFVESQQFVEMEERFKLLDKYVKSLSPDLVATILEGYESNSQIHGARFMCNNPERITGFLKKATGNEYRVKRGRIEPVIAEDDIPF